ncbi:MAG: RNA methyltransferase [Bacteroidales bacterium]|nr:RNA methyltransferase [Bacteroidales bacterium]
MKKLSLDALNRVDIPTYKQLKKSPIVVVLDNIRSLNNIGSVFRTSDAFLIDKIYLCGITAQPPHKDIHKTALGATDSVDWIYFENTLDALDDLKKTGYTIVAIEQAENSTMLQDFRFDFKQKYALVMGHEVKGVDQKVVDACDMVIEIPQFGTKHSFNISVTTGMVLWELFRQYKYSK